MEKFRINLIVGNHPYERGEREVITLLSNIDQEQLQEAYAKAAELIGVDLTKDVAADWRDNRIPDYVLDDFEEHGIVVKSKAGNSFESVEQFLDLWLQFVLKVRPDFQYEIVEEPFIYLGGRGLAD